MKLKILKTEKEYRTALKEIDKLWDSPEGSAEADRAQVLVLLVEEYERRQYPISAPDPVEAIRFRMEQQGLTTSDLAKVLGGRNRASEVLGGKRRLSLAMMRNLAREWRIPVDILLGV